MKTTEISVKVGIWETDYTIRDYGNKIVITVPYVEWCDNSGSLGYRKARIDEPGDMAAIRALAKAGEFILPANNNAGCLSIDDVIDGNRAGGVEIIEGGWND